MCIYDGYLYIGEYNDEEIPLEELMFDHSRENNKARQETILKQMYEQGYVSKEQYDEAVAHTLKRYTALSAFRCLPWKRSQP